MWNSFLEQKTDIGRLCRRNWPWRNLCNIDSAICPFVVPILLDNWPSANEASVWITFELQGTEQGVGASDTPPPKVCPCLCFHFPEVGNVWMDYYCTFPSGPFLEFEEGAFEFKGRYFKLLLLPLSFHEMLHYHHMCVAFVLVPAVQGVQWLVETLTSGFPFLPCFCEFGIAGWQFFLRVGTQRSCGSLGSKTGSSSMAAFAIDEEVWQPNHHLTNKHWNDSSWPFSSPRVPQLKFPAKVRKLVSFQNSFACC